jgi:hypothetical protein
MTCHAIYRQKARIKSKGIGGSDRLTAVCVCQRVNIYTISVRLNLLTTPDFEVLEAITLHCA